VPILTEWNRNHVPVQLVMAEDRAARPALKAVADFLRDSVDWSGRR